jgi:adenylate cyclase class IV
MKNQEIKVLDINVEQVTKDLLTLGAKKVFDNFRIITYFKNINDQGRPFLKLTEEDKLKLTSQDLSTHEEIKLFVSRKEECVSLLESLGYFAVSEVSARRISFEMGEIDCDIDIFPQIPAFLEVDTGDSRDMSLVGLLEKLNISNNTRGVMSTPEIVEFYKKDYFDLYKK